MTTNMSNSTYDDLVKLNDQRAITLIPAMVLFFLFMIMGLVGNSLVCYIIGFRFQPNNQNFLIVWLAIFDLLNCLVAIPTDIVDMRFSYTFPSAIACKILRFVMAFNSMGSAFTLIVIAIDRYRKICKPLALQMTRFHVKVALAIAVSAAVFLSWPAFFVNGLRVYESPIKGQMAQDCSTSDKIKHTLYPLIYTGVLFIAFIVLCVVLMMLYCMILMSIKRHSRDMEQKSDLNHVVKTPRGQSAAAKVDLEGMRKDAYQYHITNASKAGSVYADENRMVTDKVSLKCFQRKKSENNLEENCNSHLLGITKSPSSGEMDEAEGKTQCGATINAVRPSTGVDYPSLNREELSESANSDQVNSETTFSEDIKAECQNDDSQRGQQCDTSPKSPPRQAKTVVTNRKIDLTQHRNQPRNTSSVGRSPSTKTTRYIKTKTTVIAFLVTLVFVLSFLPYLCLQVTKTLVKGFDYNLQGAAFLFQNIFLRSYYMNSILNPFIYGALNTRFRTEVKILFRKLCCCKSR